MQSTNLLNIKELQIKKLLESNNFIAFVSYSNFNQDQIHKFKLLLSELGLSIKFIRNKRLKESLSDTRFKNMNRIFQGKVMLIYGEHDTETQKKFLQCQMLTLIMR